MKRISMTADELARRKKLIERCREIEIQRELRERKGKPFSRKEMRDMIRIYKGLVHCCKCCTMKAK